MIAPSSSSRFDCCCSSLHFVKEKCRQLATIIAIALGALIALAGFALMLQGTIYGLTGYTFIKSIAVAEKIGGIASFLVGGAGILGGVALAVAAA